VCTPQTVRVYQVHNRLHDCTAQTVREFLDCKSVHTGCTSVTNMIDCTTVQVYTTDCTSVHTDCTSVPNTTDCRSVHTDCTLLSNTVFHVHRQYQRTPETVQVYSTDCVFTDYTGCERYCCPFFEPNINLHKIFKNSNRLMKLSEIVYLYLDITFSG